MSIRRLNLASFFCLVMLYLFQSRRGVLSVNCLFQIFVLESRRHPVDLVLAEALMPPASSRHVDTALPTLSAISRALASSRSKYSATDMAKARDAVSSSSLIAVVSMRGLMSVGTGLRS